MTTRIIINIGQRFGMLEVIKETPFDITAGGKKRMFLCICDCGKKKVSRLSNLMSGSRKSCGCKKGLQRCSSINTKLYSVWSSIKYRCLNNKSKAFPNYGGRGISICKEWLHNMPAFYKWAISNGYKEGLHIDRKDNDGNYDPSNCRWVTLAENNRNKRNTVFVNYKGEKVKLLHLLENGKCVVSSNCALARIERGWSHEEAIETPPYTNRDGTPCSNKKHNKQKRL